MQRPFTFIHAADLHLDTPFKGVEAHSPEIAAILRDSTLDAFDNLVDLCIEKDAAFLVIAGDLYDGPEHGIRSGYRLREGFAKLAGEGIEVFIATGNHDPRPSDVKNKWSSYGNWPGNVHLFPPKGDSFTVVKDGDPIAAVTGASYSKREEKEDIAARISPSNEDIFQVGVAHATIGKPTDHAVYAPTTIETLQKAGIDYWALGHVHTRATIHKSSPAIAYPGNIQALSKRERGRRGALVVSVDGTGHPEVDFAPLDSVRFSTVEIDMVGVDSFGSLNDLLRKTAAKSLEESEGRVIIQTAILAGSTPLFGELAKPGAEGDLLKDLREEGLSSDPILWWNSIENATSPELDREQLLALDGLEAQIIRLADEMAADPSGSPEEIFGDLYGKSGASKHLGSPPPPHEIKEEIESARDLLLALMDEEAR